MGRQLRQLPLRFQELFLKLRGIEHECCPNDVADGALFLGSFERY